MKDLVFFGIQGSGKGTQAKILLENSEDIFSYFSTGDIFRSLTWWDNAIGNYVKDRLASWQLIDNKVTDMIFRSYVYTVLDEGKHMLLDGYPRSIPQIDSMFAFLKEENRELLWIQFVLSDDIAIERMKGRGRSDDTEASMRHRIAQFYEKTQPTIDHFAEHAELIQVDASRSIEEIAADVREIVASN